MRKGEFEAHLFHYRATVRHVVDGDTVALILDLGDSVHRRRNVRLLNVNAPEVVGESRAQGLESKAFLEELLPPGTEVYVRTFKDRTTFERLVGEIFFAEGGDELKSAGDALVEAGHATPAQGR